MADDRSSGNQVEAGMQSKTRHHRFSRVWLTASALVCFSLMLCYWFRPDRFATFTILPVWCWSLLGFLTALGWHRKLMRQFAVVVAMWLLFLFVFANEPRSLLRALVPPPPAEGARSLRVVSLNCSGGDPAAALEVMAWKPDVVLLQESPSQADVEQLARKLFGKSGGFLWGVDASIIARGKVTPRLLPRDLRNYFVRAQVTSPDSRKIEVFSLRLMTPPFRVDLWSPSCWEAYRLNRQLQRTQIDAIVRQLNALPQQQAIIIGGDFNAPQGDAIFGALRPRLQDSFASAGRGWGNTITNDFPFLRLDQIWASRALQPRNAVARKTIQSDHQAVLADFVWRTG